MIWKWVKKGFVYEWVRKAIQHFYVNGAVNEYLLRCENEIELPKELTVFIHNADIQTMPVNIDDIWPAEKYVFDFKPYKNEVNSKRN